MVSISMRDGSTAKDPRLGRLIEFDERSRNYGAVRLLTPEQQRQPRTWYWECPTILDQGSTSACTAYSNSYNLAARPVMVQGITNDFANANYCQIQLDDPWPGGSNTCPGMQPPFYEGSSVLSAVKHFYNLGFYTSYNWNFSEEEMWLSTGWIAPPIIGIAWKTDMFNPDSKGQIHPTGDDAGGHAIWVSGQSVEDQMYQLKNSWGNWSQNGYCYISRADMKILLDQNGESVTPISNPEKITI